MKKFLCIIAVLFLSVSCIQKIDNSGYDFKDIDVSSIKEGVTTKKNVLREFGSPSVKSPSNNDLEEVWIYYSDQKCGYLFFRPTIKDRKVLKLSFNENDILQSVEYKGIQNSKNIAIVQDFTKTREVKENVFYDILNNIGTVRSM